MQFTTPLLVAEFGDQDGRIERVRCGDHECVQSIEGRRPVFAVRLRDDAGHSVDLCADDARETRTFGSPESADGVRFEYLDLGGSGVTVALTVVVDHDASALRVRVAVRDVGNLIVEWVDVPGIVVPNDLVGAGGTSRIVWPATEGVLVEDVTLRERGPFRAADPDDYYPSNGWVGDYPGECCCQFMAYYGETGGLYLGVHDPESGVKKLEYYSEPSGGIRLEVKLFPGVQRGSDFEMDYDIVLQAFRGDWYEAASIYRDWYEASYPKKPQPVAENRSLPSWYADSPVVVIYPVRGHVDTGQMEPNADYYPYTHAAPMIHNLAERLGSPVLVLLAHWEGTAPWAPPYGWPPYGDQADFAEFVRQLHADGNLVGLYFSGLSWTNTSVLDPAYDLREEFERQGLAAMMATAPDGSLPNARICNGPIRWGYDICPSTEFASDVAAGEVLSAAGAGCDYVQFFDQNIGGKPAFCYSSKHAHPPIPGGMQIEAMQGILQRIETQLRELGVQTVVGCEGAASEPFIEGLPFSDLRFNIAYFWGKPIPLYEYLYHRYVSNFMGNQNPIHQVFALEEDSPNLLMRMAHAFVAGNALTLVLKGEGRVAWGWSTPWEVTGPDHDETVAFAARLNAWRRGVGWPYLFCGTMARPFPIGGVPTIAIRRVDGSEETFDAVLTSRWKGENGREAQVLVNYGDRPLRLTVVPEGSAPHRIITSPEDPGPAGARTPPWSVRLADETAISFDIDPRSVVIVEFDSPERNEP